MLKLIFRFTPRQLATALSLSMFSLMISSCSPEITPRQYKVPKTDFGPRQNDPDLNLGGVGEQSSIQLDHFRASGPVASASLLRTAENLIALGKILHRPELAKAGLEISESFYREAGAAPALVFEKTPFVDAAIGETRESSLKMLDENEVMLKEQSALLKSLLKKLESRYRWPGSGARTRDLIASVKNFVAQFLKDVKDDARIEPQVKKAVIDGINEQALPLINQLEREIVGVLAEKRTVTLLQKFLKLLDKHEIKLDRQSRKMIDQAIQVMVSIEKISDAQDVLGTIVDLWRLVDSPTRERSFKPVSPELYAYLLERSESELNCLRSFGCTDLKIIAAKQLKILPEIRKSGIAKLQAKLSSSAREGTISEIESRAAGMMKELASVVDDRLNDEFGKIQSELKKSRADYGSFIREIASGYAQLNLKSSKRGQVRGAEVSLVSVAWPNGKLDVHAPSASASTSTTSETLGASLALAVRRWELEAREETESLLAPADIISQINKALAIGGYNTESGRPFESLALSTDPALRQKHLNLRNFLGDESGYAVPDALTVKLDYSIDQDLTARVSASGQAELLRGMSVLSRFFRDWEKTAFDETLGQVEVRDYIKRLPAQSVQQKLFPKDMMFAVSLGNAAVILQNITKKLSTVFLIDIEKRISWGNEMQTQGENYATMAGVVDLELGKREAVARSRDAARYLISIVEFLEATKGSEATQAGPLLEVGSDGKRAIDTLLEARSQLRLAVVGLANFLSHQMQDKDGGIRASFDLNDVVTQTNESRVLLDQALAIQALVKAGDFLGSDIYYWSARDVLAFMNRELWDAQLGFYRSSAPLEAASVQREMVWAMEDLTATLVAGEMLRPHLPEKSHRQWQNIAAPWLAALQK